jgi:hypothetical protein
MTVSIQAPKPDLEISMAQQKNHQAETTQDVSITSWKLHSTWFGVASMERPGWGGLARLG